MTTECCFCHEPLGHILPVSPDFHFKCVDKEALRRGLPLPSPYGPAWHDSYATTGRYLKLVQELEVERDALRATVVAANETVALVQDRVQALRGALVVIETTTAEGRIHDLARAALEGRDE